METMIVVEISGKQQNYNTGMHCRTISGFKKIKLLNFNVENKVDRIVTTSISKLTFNCTKAGSVMMYLTCA